MNNMICTCYIDANDTRDKNLMQKLQKIDFNKITHIAIAFAQLKESDGFWVANIKDSVASGIEKINAQIFSGGFDVKLLLSVGGAGADGFCQAARTAQGRKRFAESVVSILDRYKLDGVDIDWEYPGESSLGITRCKHCKSDFILLLEELRSHLKNRLLTIAVGSNRYFGMNVKK